MNIYSLHHQAKCPNGELIDCYKIEIRSPTTILVESILESLRKLPEVAFQEDIATTLRNDLGAHITVTGWHHGIKITSIRK